MTDPELFTFKMRKSTRKIHAISDALINAKLALALNSNAVWSEGLIVFYEIFKFLENAMIKKQDENLGKLCIKEMFRTSAFEQDLEYYYGENWKYNYKTRESVANYLSHLKCLYVHDPDLLMAYVYHLYMGLMSGGQILRKKRELKNKIFPSKAKGMGEAVTDFGDVEISELKNRLKDAMNSVASTLSDTKKERLLQEGQKVFELNNAIVKSIQNTGPVLMRRLLILCAGCILVFLFYIGLIFF